MKKRNTPQRIILKLRDGSLTDQGFSASIESGEEGVQATERNEGHLPAHPEIREAFSKWQTVFEIIAGVRRIEPKVPPQTFSCEKSANALENSLNDWLNRGDREEWRKIRDFLMTQATKHNVEEGKGEVTRIIVQTNDSELWQLPWSALDLSRLGIKAEIAFSLSEWKGKTGRLPKGTRVRILAVLGNSEGINTDLDRKALKKYAPQADIKVLPQPSKAELLEHLRSDAGWHIFFFAGHSGTNKEEHIGQFEINKEEILTIEELKHHFEIAIGNGLQLAVFNSCDGVELAKQLAELNLPQSIVMRLPVPDKVAQRFLQLFLERFAKQGKSLYAAVYETRGILEDEFKQYPGVGWLPMLCQNPAVVAGSWEEWTRTRERIRKTGLRTLNILLLLTVIGSLSSFFYPLWLDGRVKPIEVDIKYSCAPSSPGHPHQPLENGKQLTPGDVCQIEETRANESDRYMYVYHIDNEGAVSDVVRLTFEKIPKATPRVEKMFKEHRITGRELMIPLRGTIISPGGKETFCVMAFNRANPYLDNLEVDGRGLVTGSNSKWYYSLWKWQWNLISYLTNNCPKKNLRTFENLGKR